MLERNAQCRRLYRGRQAASEAVGKCPGRSIVYYVDNTGIFNGRMELRFGPDG